MSDSILQKRRALLWQLFEDYCAVYFHTSGLLVFGPIKMLGAANLAESLGPVDGTLSTAVRLMGHGLAQSGQQASGTIALRVMADGMVSTGNPEAGGGQIAFRIGSSGRANADFSAPVAGGMRLLVDIDGLADAVASTPTGGLVAFQVGLQGKAVDNTAVPGEGVLLLSVDTQALASIAQQVLSTEQQLSTGSVDLAAVARLVVHGTDRKSAEGVLNAGDMVSPVAKPTVDSYTIEENDAGGLTYTINASVYEFVELTLKVW